MPPRRPLSRSEQMSRIRGQNTEPELLLRAALWSAGLRYRVHAKTPVGRPDLVFLGPRVAVFIDGCFWHGCPLHYVRPRSRTEHWAAKLRVNVERDRRQTLDLEALGWRVVRVWEHEVYGTLGHVVDRIRQVVAGVESAYPADWRVVKVEEIDCALRIERRHLEQLRDASVRKMGEGRRITAKWRRPQVL
jgi:DNA mismatch endonuclease, patch repair protein